MLYKLINKTTAMLTICLFVNKDMFFYAVLCNNHHELALFSCCRNNANMVVSAVLLNVRETELD